MLHLSFLSFLSSVLLALCVDGNDNTVGGGYSLLSFNLPLVFWALVLGGTPGLHDIPGFDAELHQVILFILINININMLG